MAKLYYGNGNCTIEGSEVLGVQINYEGSIEIYDRTPENFNILKSNNRILIFSLATTDQFLNNLFDYNGTFKIKSIIIAGLKGEKIESTVHKVMDYAELLGVSETLTINSEDLNSAYTTRKIRDKSNEVSNIIEGLNTRRNSAELYLKDGTKYNGDYHVHIDSLNVMTGKTHTEDSKDLYLLIHKYRNGGKLSLLKDSGIPKVGIKGNAFNTKKPKSTKHSKIKNRKKTTSISKNLNRGSTRTGSTRGGY